MDNKAAIQDVVQAYIREQGPGFSVSELARRVGIPQATLNRMLAPNDPVYRGDPDSWLKLARYPPLHLTPREVLAAIWLEPHERASTRAGYDPIYEMRRAWRQLGIPDSSQAALMVVIEPLIRAAGTPRSVPSQ